MERLSELTQQMREKHVGRLADRFLRALVMGRGSAEAAAHYARSTRWVEAGTLEDVFTKAATPALSEENQAAIFAAVGQDLIALMRPLSIFEQLSAAFRRVPALTQLVTQTGGASGYWVDAYQGGGAAVPASALSFSRAPGIEEKRVAALAVVVEELARTSVPATELTISLDLARALAAVIDSAFLNPFVSGSPATQPASVTASGRIFQSSGADLASIDADLERLASAVHDGGGDLGASYWCMNDLTLVRLARLRGSGGALAFPNLSITGGGTLSGLPVLASKNITRSGSPSPGTTYLSLICPPRIWQTANDAMNFSAARHALVEMSDAPTMDASSATPATATSLFQTSSVGLKAVRYIGWQPTAGTGHAATLVSVEY